jgi:selenide,water dikinase
MKRLNRTAARILCELNAHACTDVTGFGLLGHLREMTAASGVDAEVRLPAVPWIPGALDHASAGEAPGGLAANRRFLEPHLDLPPDADRLLVDLLFDPQTSGGLLVSLPPERAEELVSRLAAEGEPEARVIGVCRPGSGRIRVRAD